jgi:hypothetical protein
MLARRRSRLGKLSEADFAYGSVGLRGNPPTQGIRARAELTVVANPTACIHRRLTITLAAKFVCNLPRRPVAALPYVLALAPTAKSSPAPENFFSKTPSVIKATPF